MTTVETPRQVAATVSSNGTLQAGKHTPVDATSGNRTMTLPTGVTPGAHLSVEKIDNGSNTVTITGSIRGTGSSTYVLGGQYDKVTFSADSTGSWWPTASSLAGASLSSAYSTIAGAGARIAWLGDSITQGAVQNQNQSYGQAYPVVAQLLLGGKGLTVRNAGEAGNTSAQMLARFDTDVTPYTPNVVAILAGTNDIGDQQFGTGATLAQFAATMKALVAKIHAIGATPVLATIPPNNDTTLLAQIALFNVWISRYAASIAAPLIDHHSVLTDPTTGTYKSGYTSDGTHPTVVGQQAMGQAAATVLAAYLRPWAPPLVQSQTDTVQILGSNPLWLTDSNADGVPDGWSSYGDANTVATLVTDATVPGKMVKLTATGATGVHVFELNITTGFTAGDTIVLAGILTSDGGIPVQIRANFWDVSKSAAALDSVQVTVTRGLFYIEAVVPVGAVNIAFQILPNAGTGYVQVGQFSAYNLTALALP